MTNTPALQPDPENTATGNPARAQAVTTFLGYAGLVPFMVAALAAASDTAWSLKAVQIASAYAFGIVCFLTGTWWGLALRENHTYALWLSNVFFLLCFFTYGFMPAWWPLVAAMLLLGIFLLEQKTALFPPFAAHYRTLRTLLTLVAGLCMLVIQFAS